MTDRTDTSVTPSGASDSSAPATDDPNVQVVRPRHTILSIQVMRAIAAIAVAFYHTQLIFGQPEYGHVIMGGFVSRLGWSGVNFFFVLSGFIIMYAHFGDLGRPAALGRYAWRRVVRIYPIYWLCLTAYIGAALLGIGHPDFRKTWPDMLSAYTLLPFDPAPSLPIKVAWTLFYEVGFYFIFAFLILSRRLGILLMALWGAAVLVCGLAFGWTDMGLLNIWNAYFLIGAGLYLAYRHVPPAWGLPMLVAGVATFAAMAWAGLVPERIAEAQARPWLLLALAVPFGLALLGGTLAERHRGWRAPAWAVLLGEASYSIYLVHSPVLSVLAGFHRKHGFGLINPTVLFVGSALLAIAVGLVTHIVAEKPLLGILRRFGRRRGIDKPAVRVGTA